MARTFCFDSGFGVGFKRFLYALPNVVEGGKIETIDQTSVKISPNEAIQKAHEFAGKTLPTTALTLLMRDGKPFIKQSAEWARIRF